MCHLTDTEQKIISISSIFTIMSALPQPSVQHARNYVGRVKHALGSSSPQYRLFLSTLKGYRTQELTPQEVIYRISDLFQGRHELILGFNAFLPEEYQIRPPEDEGVGDNGNAPVVVPIFDDEEARREYDQQPSPAAAASSSSRGATGAVDVKDEHQSDEEDSPSNKARHRGPPQVRAAQDASPQQQPQPQQRSRKRSRVRVTSSKTTSKNIKYTSPSTARSTTSSTTITTSPTKSNVPSQHYKYKQLNSTTQILLSPPSLQPTDYLHPYTPLADGEFTYNLNTDHVNCKLCHGKRDIIATTNNEPVLLCEQRGCNAEYHLGCLFAVRPSLFEKQDETKHHTGGKKEGDDVAMENVDGNNNDKNNNNEASNANDNSNNAHPQQLEVPSGDIYCTTCHTHGATSVLQKYFDKIDYERSHYTCSRAYVTSLLEKHMGENPTGNVNDMEKKPSQLKEGMTVPSDEVQLKASPQSELWYAGELNAQALLGSNTEEEDAGNPQANKGKKAAKNSAELLIGKPVRLYNNLDNEYHVGRIVDWRTCTAYPPLYKNRDGPPVTSNNAIQMKYLEYYGIGPLATAEYLVRFPTGLQGRKKELLRWIVLEEHSLAVGVSLIQGKTAKLKGGSAKGWKPAMILARSALELVTVRQFLHEDMYGNLFAKMKSSNVGGSGTGSAGVDDRWALASFFGEEQHALLNLREEARDLLVDVVTNSNSDEANKEGDSNGENDKKITGEAEGTFPSNNDDVSQASVSPSDEEEKLFQREALASVDVPMGLALAEQSEQARCKEWCKLILHKSGHEHALVSPDEYSTQLNLEKLAQAVQIEESEGVDEETDVGVASNSKPTNNESESGPTNKCIQPLVERGIDRLWLAHLVERVSGQSVQRSKDTIMSFECKDVSSVSSAIASLQRQ